MVTRVKWQVAVSLSSLRRNGCSRTAKGAQATTNSYLAEHHKRRLSPQLLHMLHPVVIPVKRRINLQIDLLRRIQPLVLRVRHPIPVSVATSSYATMYGHALWPILVSLVQDVVQAQVRIEHEVLEPMEFQYVAMQRAVFCRR